MVQRIFGIISLVSLLLIWFPFIRYPDSIILLSLLVLIDGILLIKISRKKAQVGRKGDEKREEERYGSVIQNE
jgi:hypothetical protein